MVSTFLTKRTGFGKTKPSHRVTNCYARAKTSIQQLSSGHRVPNALKEVVQLESLALVTKDEAKVDVLKDLYDFNNNEQKDAQVGAGPLGYKGQVNQEGTLFFGFSEGTKNYMVKFMDNPLESLKDLYNDETRAGLTDGWSCQQVNLQVFLQPTSAFQTIENVRVAQQATLSAQTSNKRTVAIKNDLLTVGVKGSNSFLQMGFETATAQTVNLSSIFYLLTLRGTAAKAFLNTFLSSDMVNLENVIAFFLVEGLHELSTSELFQFFKKSLEKNYTVLNVSKLSSTNPSAPWEKHINTSFSSIENKLVSPSYSAVTQNIFIDRLTKLIEKEVDISPSLSTFCEKAIDVLKKGIKEPKAKPSEGSK